MSKKHTVHTPEALAEHIANIKKLGKFKQQLKEVEDKIAALDESAEKLEHSIMPQLTIENTKKIEDYYKLQTKALIGQQIALKYSINDLERDLLDFEAAALMED